MAQDTATILIVDDTPANLSVLFDLLDRAGFEVAVASNGVNALHRLNHVRPDLILLDIMMPEMDGFETCRRLKADKAARDIPVIFMTAITDTENKVKGLALGAVDYITKPIQPPEVLARVNTHLTLQRLQNELKAQRDELQLKNRLLLDREAHLTYLVEEKTLKIGNITIALVNALENANALNDTDTGSHIRRVSAYAALLAEKYGCGADFVKRIKLYASLHDVGKVGLSDALLKKTGPYTPEEFVQMQQHVVFGAQLLESEELDVMARNIARYHHEKWDGTGYVEHLAGAAIPLEARIVTIVDVYDALISKRVYKPEFSEETADDIIRKESGKQFDPKIVEIFFTCKRDLLDLRSEFLIE